MAYGLVTARLINPAVLGVREDSGCLSPRAARGDDSSRCRHNSLEGTGATTMAIVDESMPAASTSAQGAKSSVELALGIAAEQNLLEGEWQPLRAYILQAITRNVRAYLDSPPPRPSTPTPPASSQTPNASSNSGILLSSSPGQASEDPNDPALQPSTPGGLVLPPFPPRQKAGAGTHGSTDIRGSNGIISFLTDDASIGGKTLPSTMDEQSALAECERVSSLLDAFTGAPPFTLQRLAELARAPTAHYRTVGKYLRALERALLVTSEWEPSDPSLAISSFTPAEGSTVPLGSTTPMFSPIPFLVRPESDDGQHAGSSNPPGSHAEVPPSPLALDPARSPTPEPEDAQPFVGVVDELDAGPSTSTGKGEGGTLVPHAIADHPTPISSTTTVSSPPEVERKVAPLPTTKLGDRFVSSGTKEVE